jgi:membrane dipeptidase
VNPQISERARSLLKRTVLWDNHACLPLRAEDETFLPQLARYKAADVSLVSLNIYFDMYPPETAFLMLAAFRQWVAQHPQDYVLAETVATIEAAKLERKLAIAFDIEGGKAVEAHPGLVEIFYRLGVRWMLIAYNKNNRLGGGCQDEDTGLTDYGRKIIDEMERVGMVLCCSHTGYRTAREAMEYSKRPVIFSHSNSRAIKDHDRNIPDDLMRACARTEGVVSLNGIGTFLGENDNSTEALLRHIDYAAGLIGPEHVGLGLDYVFDQAELDAYKRARPDLYPPEKGYRTGTLMIEPERFPWIADALLTRGYSESQVQGILGHNSLRIARNVWK